MDSLLLSDLAAAWRDAAGTKGTGGFASVPMQDAVLALGREESSGRTFFFFTDKKGGRVPFMSVDTDKSALGSAVERAVRRSLREVPWMPQGEDVLFLDEYPELCGHLFVPQNAILFGDRAIRAATQTQDASIVLEVQDGQPMVTLRPLVRTQEGMCQSPTALSQEYVLCGSQVWRVNNLGEQYALLGRFWGTVTQDELDQTLSIFASMFPAAELLSPGYTVTRLPKAQAEPAIQFRGLDGSGNLCLSLLWCKEPFPAEFISQSRPAQLVRLDRQNKTIVVCAIGYDAAHSPRKKMESLLRSCLRRHPECVQDGGDGFAFDGDSAYVTAALALPFLTENVSELARDYRLFGTDALRPFKLRAVSPKTRLSVSSGIDFLDTTCTVSVDIDGQVFTPSQAVELYERNSFIPLNDGSRAIIDRQFFARLKRLLGKQQKDGGYAISFFDLPLVDSLINAKVEEDGVSPCRAFYSGFDAIQSIALPDVPSAHKLRDYQRYGVQWMTYLAQNGLGGCLADDMGLGKTIQTITLLAGAYSAGKRLSPSLVVVPKSLVANWQAELLEFAPQLDVAVYYGADRDLEQAMAHQVVLTTYAIVRNDNEQLQKQRFEYIVMDEVQAIKNTASHASKAAMLLNGTHRFALSGTPMENNLGELYSLFRFLNPTMFGGEAEFSRRYAVPIQKEGDADSAKELSAKIRPFILRRLKQDVAKELPERTEQILYVDMTPKQAALYEQQRVFYQRVIAGEIAAKGFEKSQFCILQALSELRQIATVPETRSAGDIEGAKWEPLVQAILDLAQSGHRCLVFSNFLASLDAVGERLLAQQVPCLAMTGATANRAELVKKFQQDETYKAFLMTLKTGGVGLNLTGADYVFLLDPWWNRSAEQQAIDRTHRIGQKRGVFCYRLIARGTIEEKILELQKQKADLFSAVISSDGQLFKKLSAEDIDYLLKE